MAIVIVIVAVVVAWYFLGNHDTQATKEALKLKIDYKLNKELPCGKEAVLSKEDSPIKVVIIPTDEEVMIARDAYALLLKKEKSC